MLLSELLTPDLVILDLKARDKRDIIAEMVDLFVQSGIVTDKEKFIEMVEKREQIESTAIGGGIAIPHARSEVVKQLRVGFARSKEGVDFDALDRKPVHLIFMIAAPIDVRKEYLQAVAKVARLLKSSVMRKALMDAETKEDVMRVIMDFDGVVPERVEVKTKEGRVIYKQGEQPKGG